jgi:phenylacetate-CoA ligase
MYAELTEAERFPLLTPAGRKLLHAMRQHPQAPAWNWPNGEQLNAAGLARVQQFAADLAAKPAFRPDRTPDWLPEFVSFCLEEVPFYRRRSPPGTPLASIPSCSRADLAPRVWDFVPDSQPLDELIVFSSSGTTGYPTQTPHHPASAACGLPLIERAVAGTGISFPRGADQMALTNIAAYRGAYTTAIVMAWLQEAGCIRVNLIPEVWRQPADCPAYLDRFWAPVMLGDPQAFAALEHVSIERPPEVMVSCILELSDVLAAQLAMRYGCPVIDLYALTEAGIVAAKSPQGHAILPHDLYVEILDDHDELCPPGVRGEVTLTGGRNPFLPLLRYRTGDFASLAWHDGQPTLVGLEGRRPVGFPVGDKIVHSMEVTRVLRKFPLAQYLLHQDEAGGFRFGYRGVASEEDLREALCELLGSASKLHIAELPPPTTGRQKVLVYQSLHPAASAPSG